MANYGSKFFIACAWAFFLFGTAHAAGDNTFLKQVTETMAKVRISP